MTFQCFKTAKGESIAVYRPTSEPRPSCYGCGRCCIGNLRVQPEVADKIDPAYIDEHGYLRHDSSGRCIFLDAQNLCSIYENRPKVCRDFARGSNPKCFDTPCKLLAVLAR